MQTSLYTKVIERLRHYSWRHTFESVGLLKGLLLKGALVVTGRFTVELGLAVCHLSKQIILMSKRSGLLFTALYLKQCAVVLQRYYALKDPKQLKGQKLDVSVSLSRSGLPRIIPLIHRKRIRLHDDRADYLVRLYLTWFSLAKVIKLAKPLRASSITSITDDYLDFPRVLKVEASLAERFSRLVKRYLPWLHEFPLEKGFSWRPTWKVSPNKRNKLSGATPSIFGSIALELQAIPQEDDSGRRLYWDTVLLAQLAVPGTLYPLDHTWNNRLCLGSGVDILAHQQDRIDRAKERLIKPPEEVLYGRVAAVIEGAGKRRLFCIGNYVRQRVMAPFHQWAMSILRKLPQDGTFHQEAPLFRLRSFRPEVVSSYDLKSATDRFPVSFSSKVVELIFGAVYGRSLVRNCLASASFNLGPPVIRGKPSIINFYCGQPLGYLGSWALFALSHHFVVWMAADDIYPDAIAPFRRYALLGDDIVIADIAVARRYRKYLKRLGVSISIPKSIISDNGSLEFAKRYWTNKLTVDCSPVSLKSLMVSQSSLGLCAIGQKYQLPLNLVLRLGGAGFRVRGRGQNQVARKWRRLTRSYTRFTWGSRLPIEWWLAGGKPLSPYIHGHLLGQVKKAFKPRMLTLPPWYLDDSVDMEVEERRLLRGWMSMWLEASRKYYLLLQKGETSLEAYFDLPLVQASWTVNSFDEDIFKYGLFWKLADQAMTLPPYLGFAITSREPEGLASSDSESTNLTGVTSSSIEETTGS